MLWVLKPSQWDGSFEHPKHILKLMGNKIFTILRSKIMFIKTCGYLSDCMDGPLFLLTNRFSNDVAQ